MLIPYRMSVINQQVYAAPGVLYSSISGGGGGGGVPQNLTISTLSVGEFANVSNQNGSALNLRMESLNQSTFHVILTPGSGTTELVMRTDPNNIEIKNADFLVSSINGAAPGGSIPPNINTSSIVCNNISIPSVVGTNGILYSNATGAQFGVDTTSGNDLRVSFYTNAGNDCGIQILTDNAGSGNTSIFGLGSGFIALSNISSINGATPGGGVAPGADLPGLSSIGVSSINGSQPTGKASYQVSTLTGTQTYVPQGNVAWPLSGDIPVTPGHLYRISGVCAVSNGATGNTSFLISGGGAGFPSAFAAYQNAAAIPGNGGFAAGIQTIFKPNASPVQVIAYNTDGTTSTGLDFYNPNWLVEDLGTNL